MSGLTVEALSAGYGAHAVLRDAALTVPAGRLVALLGPSGCGKTTLLRAVAGLHRPQSGRVVLDGRVLDGDGQHVPTHRRRITLVPQEAALFPHLDVAANVAFGLTDETDPRARVEHLLELVGLDGLGARAPHQLSGGQQHRVALARALAPRPDLVLLDEPFSALDARLRDQLRQEVRELLHRESATALLVTHDQREALSLADEVAVMREGVVCQQAPPEQLYARPADAWTARFVGDSVLLDATVDGTHADTALGRFPVSGASAGPRGMGLVVLRPEQLRLGDIGAPGRVERATYGGHDSVIDVRLHDRLTVTVRLSGTAPRPGDEVHVSVTGTGWLLPDPPPSR